MKDVIRISSAVPRLKLADVDFNCTQIIDCTKKADAENGAVVLFPELALTGYTCGDLFFQDSLINAVAGGIDRIVNETASIGNVAVFGAPLKIRGQLYNVAIVTSGGRVHGIVPKTFLPNYNEFSEKRWFSSSKDLNCDSISSCELGLAGDYVIPVGRDIIFEFGRGITFGIEICEDLWTPLPPSSFLALSGAQIILNLSASNETVNKRSYRRALVLDQSLKCCSAYVYTSSGYYESTTDLVFSGHTVFALDGTLIAENKDKLSSDYILSADLDLGRINADRIRTTVFKDSTTLYGRYQLSRYVNISGINAESDGELIHVSPSPFLDCDNKDEYCRDIFDMQVTALMRRLELTNTVPIVGVSGGLDSTLALLVSLEAVKRMGKKPADVHGITLPCFGTSGRTYNNAVKLMKTLGVSIREINIKDAVLAHFKDIGHDPDTLDLTYENAQARERTQVLMDYAGRVAGLVVGTGDLSELALGWCTYNADHMSMYSVNAGIPKTLISAVIGSLVSHGAFASAGDVLADILSTPISPELLPPDKSGAISQETENIVGPYELHDFYLYYIIRYGFEPEKIYELAKRAFKGVYDNKTLLKWLKNFYRRFFTQQFKRSCQPDGVKVTCISFSPRGDWRMPSDASAKLWLDAAEALCE